MSDVEDFPKLVEEEDPPKQKRERPPPESRWLYTRRSAAEMLDVSIDTVKEFERRGELTPVRLNGPRARVHYCRDQLQALIDGARSKKPKTIT